MIKHNQIQKRFRSLRKNRLYAHSGGKREEDQQDHSAANLNLCKRMMYNYFGDRQELE